MFGEYFTTCRDGHSYDWRAIDMHDIINCILTLSLPTHSGSGNHKVDISEGEEVEVRIWTRSVSGGKFSIKNGDSKAELVPEMEIKHTGGTGATDKPTQVVLTGSTKLKGPLNLKVYCNSNSGRFTTERFLVEFCIY